MRTFVPFKLIALFLLAATYSFSQTNQGLVFKNPTLTSAASTDLKAGATYLFKGVRRGVNAIVKIDSVVNGAVVKKIDDNSNGLGYLDAFQPEIDIPSGTGTSYAVFNISFIDSLTGIAQVMNSVQATALDIDGNAKLKELVDFNMNGGTTTFMSTSLDIAVSQILSRFRAINILGIERGGIDTSAKGNMFTVSKTNISSFSVKLGATTLNGGGQRQFSLFMKGFNYANAATLPVKLVSFTAVLNNNQTKVDLKWVTASEINVSHFVIERSFDGKEFNDAGIMFAAGNSSETLNYSFSDNVGTGHQVIYYRLRSVDIDSKTQASEIRVVRVGKPSEILSLVTYPNPVTTELRVTLPASWQNKAAVIELFNQNGQRVKTITTSNASQTETLNLSDVNRGLYFIKASHEGTVLQQKVIKN